MFIVNIENKKTKKSWKGALPGGKPFPTREEAEAWLKQQIGKPERLPEREVEFKEDIPQEDIKEIKEVVIDTDDEKPIVKKVAVLVSEFTYEIKDLKADVEYLTNEAMQNRAREYPSQAEINEAFFALLEKDESKVAELLAKKKAVDEKYPLPKERVKKGVH